MQAAIALNANVFAPLANVKIHVGVAQVVVEVCLWYAISIAYGHLIAREKQRPAFGIGQAEKMIGVRALHAGVQRINQERRGVKAGGAVVAIHLDAG